MQRGARKRSIGDRHAVLLEDLVGAIEADLGGADHLSVGERQLIQRAAVTGALLEDMEALWVAGRPSTWRSMRRW